MGGGSKWDGKQYTNNRHIYMRHIYNQNFCIRAGESSKRLNVFNMLFCCFKHNIRRTRYTLKSIQRTSIAVTYIILLCINVFFLALQRLFLFRPRVVSRALGSVARREPARTPRASFEPWPRSVVRALGVESGKSPRGRISSTQSLQTHVHNTCGIF